MRQFRRRLASLLPYFAADPVHILQGDLILHKRTLEPIKTVVYGLRQYDDERVAVMSERVDPSMKIQGYMSHKAKIYLVRTLLPPRWPWSVC